MSGTERPRGDWGDHPVRRMPVARLRELLRRILIAAGCNAENAQASAEGFVEADMRGVGRQGADHIGNLLEDLEAGVVNGSARPVVAREGPAFAVVDGAWATGHAGAFLATDTAIAKARDAGCAAVALTNGADIYMIGIYGGRIAEAGLVGMVFTASSSLVHPFGGVDRRLGTNPFAIGIPTGSGVPIVQDISTSAVSHSTVRQSAYLGLPLPEGVGVDRDGNPSTDAEAVLEGAIAPLAGYKGFGLGLCVALLAGPLTGGAVGRALAGWHDPGLPAQSRADTSSSQWIPPLSGSPRTSSGRWTHTSTRSAARDARRVSIASGFPASVPTRRAETPSKTGYSSSRRVGPASSPTRNGLGRGARLNPAGAS